MPNVFVKTLSVTPNGVEIEAELASPGVEITGYNVRETEGSTDIRFTSVLHDGIWAQVLVKKSVSVPLSGAALAGPRTINVVMDDVVAKTVRI